MLKKKILYYTRKIKSLTEAVLYSGGSYCIANLGGSLLHSRGSCWSGFPPLYKCYIGISGVSFNDILLKELSDCHKLWFSNPYIFETQCHRTLTFQTFNSIRSNSKSLKYSKFTPSGCIFIGIKFIFRKLEFTVQCSLILNLLVFILFFKL